MNMLGLAKRVKARILQASTSEIYGDPEFSPQTEDYWGHVNCTGVRSCYDEGKRAAETLCFDYHRQNGDDITVYGEGQQTRAFCYVDDLVDGLIRLMNQEHTIGPVNIGNPGEFTIKQLAELCVEKTGSKSKIIYLPLPGDDPKQRKPDITKARKYLQWEPKVPLEKGLDFAITYFRELDLGRFKKPTKHTAHLNTDALEGDKKRQKSA